MCGEPMRPVPLAKEASWPLVAPKKAPKKVELPPGFDERRQL